MTDCGFLTATQAREKTRNSTVVHSEMCAIEGAILANIDLGVLYANVTSGTTMTDSTDYYNAYFDVTADASKVDQLDYVSRHFKNLGYSVKIKENLSTGNTITWNLSW